MEITKFLTLCIITQCFWITLFRVKACRIWRGEKLILTIVGFDLTLIVVGILKLLGWFQILKDSLISKRGGVAPARNDEIVTRNPPNKHLVTLIRFAMSTLDKAIKVFGLYFQINIENIRILDLKFNVKGSQIQQIKLKTLSIPSVRISQQASNYHIDIPAIKATQELYVYVLKVMDYFGNPYDQQNVIQEIHIEKRSGSSFLSELLKSPVYVTVNIGKIRLVIDQIKITMSLVTTIELMEEYHQTRGKIQIETKCGELLVIDDFESSRNGRSSSLQMSMDCELNFSLQHFVSILSSFMPFIEQQKMRKPTKNAIKTDPLMLLATIPRFVLNLELPNQICTTTVFDSLKITNDFEGNWIVNAGQIRTEFPITGGGLFDSGERIHSFLELLDFRLLAILEKDDMPTQLQFSLHQSKVVVPNAWPMYNIVENGICLQKAIKSMILDALEKSPRDFSSGKTFSKLSWFPVISLSSNLVEVLFEDDPFEVKLARNYKVGYLQNLQRLEREKAFASKLGEIDTNNRKSYLMKSPGNESSKQDLISVAWRLMQRKGCAEYIQAIRLASARPEPPLLHAKITDMKLFVCSTVSEKDPIEVLLNQIDSSTLADAIYDDLLPLNYSGTLCGLEVRLRDYSNPLLLIDPSIATICETKGSLIIAEPKTAADSYRYVILPIGEDQSILVRRNINPAKFYFDVTSIIDSNHSSYLCVGAAFEGALNDVINIIDDFTAVTEDPSPPLGWWDKLRLVLHGKFVFKTLGNNDIKLRILGSMVPTFDAQHHYGVQGAEFSFATGVELTMGGDVTGISVRCGELKLSMPKAVIGVEELHPICFAKLTGGVNMVVDCEFFIKKKGKVIPPIVNHTDIKLLATSSLRVLRIPFDKVDAFSGFRSHTIRLKVMIDSPREYFADLPSPQNVLFLNDETIDIIDHLMNVYQSLLTNLPIRRGSLFNEVVTHKKPKLSRVVRIIQLCTKFKPLVLSFVLQAEYKGGEYLGFRIRSKQASLNALFQQYTVKDIPEIGQIKADKKPVAKWTRVENAVSFIDLEARVLSNSEDKAFSLDTVTDGAEWVFTEDYAFRSVSKLGLLPCLWSPRLDFTRQQASARKEPKSQIFNMQSTFLKHRQGEIESLISQNQYKIDKLQTRTKILFEQDQDSVVNEIQKLESISRDLLAKRDVIFKELERCRLSTSSNERSNQSQEAAFDSNYILHNVRILWNVSVRNIIFRILQIWDRNSSMRYCLSNSAAQVITELVNAMQNVRRGSLLMPNLGQMDNSSSNNLLETILQDLKEGGSLIVPCETDEKKALSPKNAAKQQTFLNWDDIDQDKNYNASIVRFINPQVNFEVIGTSTGQNYVLMAAKSLELKFMREIDSEKQFIQMYKTQQDRIITFRNSWAVSETQFLIQKVNSDSTAQVHEDQKNLPWVPLECLLDSRLEDEQFVRVVDKADVIFRSDKENPLYINRKQRSRESKEERFPNSYYLKIPTLKLSAGSKEYLILVDWFANLLYYRDARSGESSEKAKKMLLTLEQSGELNSFKLLVLSLQDQIKQIDYLVQYDPTQKTKDALDQLVQARNHLKEDLYILIEGLKNLMQVSTKRRSVKADWKLTIKIEVFNWQLLRTTKDPFCKWGMNSLKFVSLNNEDLSSKNTLIVNSAVVENINGTKKKSVLSTYFPDSILDSDKFMRVYWHENAPVAGIKVVDHFEVNLHPLMIQMTYDFGVELAGYMFPNRNSTGSKKKGPSSHRPEIEHESSPQELVQSELSDENNQILEMQLRAERNRSFIYIKVPGVQHCISYRGRKETNFEDLQNFVVQLPTLEYRNRTWSWYDFLNALKKDALRAALANTGSLLREKLFVRKPTVVEDSNLNATNTDLTKPEISAGNERKLKTTTASLLKASLQRKFSGRRPETSTQYKSNESIASVRGSHESLTGGTNSTASDGRDEIDAELLRKGQILLGKQFTLCYGAGLGV